MKDLVRKVVTAIEDTYVEGGRKADRPLRIVTAAAVIQNPWSGRFVEDLTPAILEFAPVLGELLVPTAIELAGGAEAVEAYGKAGIVGTNGEIEHASALIHTLRFGNVLRDAARGTSFLPFTNTRGGPGHLLHVPMKNKVKEKEGSRAHFLTATLSVPDAPGPDEILIGIGVATGGRPHHRIGDRYQDMSEMGTDETGAKLPEHA
ncbi:amino acid synthesis family protein [Lutibaculum baratangense]|uniref:Peptide synthase n=1 Tax=Lutibaculum baratangense AMV1 TaxID=631454 RepID=V4TG00_9HYPH|nr:amino acid synthesis family protein [Lutibaculum baratangense]ESR25053.1 protein of unknown function DUF1185 [Lutibaculum baratangense AMV1]